MSRETPAQVARALLLKLLAQVDRGGRDSVPIGERSAHAYFALRDLSERDALHALLQNAQAAGGIVLEWGRGPAAQDLRRIRIRDPDQLAAWLGVSRAATQARAILQGLDPLMADAPSWLRDAYADALRQWRRGGTPYRIAGTEPATAVNLFKAARAIAAGEQEGLDLRRFSVRLLGNSKALEALLGRLGPLLRHNPDWAQWQEDVDLFRVLGLEKFPPPLFLKGPLVLDYGGEDWDLTPLRPFVALSPDAVNRVQASTQVPYLLTIENLASFQRQVREVQDNGIVIYTAGYPAPALVRFLGLLDKCLPAGCPCYHWGDRDLGGLRIHARIAAACSRHPVLPHLMAEPDPATAAGGLASRAGLDQSRSADGSAGAEVSLRPSRGPGPSPTPSPSLSPSPGSGTGPRRTSVAGAPPSTNSQARGWTRDELRALQLAAATAGVVGDLARRWLHQGLHPLEQEALDPVSPVAAEIPSAEVQAS